jgi:hypothetical protein
MALAGRAAGPVNSSHDKDRLLDLLKENLDARGEANWKEMSDRQIARGGRMPEILKRLNRIPQ